jgi:Tol biopolymer transport system component
MSKYGMRPLGLVLLTLTITACGSGNSNWSEEKELRLQALAGEISATVVYERKEEIYKAEIGNLTPIFIADGTYPRWSPDGQYIAFLRGNALMRVPAAGGEPEVIASIADPRVIAYHPNGLEIWFTDGASVNSVNLLTREVRVVLSDFTARELDLSGDGQRLVATISTGRSYAVVGIDFATGLVKTLDSGCSSSISPDGTLVTSNTSDHETLLILNWETAQSIANITPEDGNEYDNQFWSNAPLWIVAVGSSPDDVFVQYIGDNRSVQVTAIGRCSHADLFVH